MSTISNGQQFAQPESDEIDLSALLHEMWIHKWLISFVVIMTLGLGIFYVSRQIPQYYADVLLQIEAGQSRFGSTDRAATQLIFGSAKGDSVSTQMALIKSRFILEPVVNTLGLNIQSEPTKPSFWKRFFPAKKKTINIQSFNVLRKNLNKSFSIHFDKPGHIQLYDAAGYQILQGPIGQLLKNTKGSIQLNVASIDAPVGSSFSLTKRSSISVVNALAKQLKIEESGEKMRQNTGILAMSLVGDKPEKIIRILNEVAKATREKDSQKKAEEASQTLDFLNQQLPLTKKMLEQSEKALNQYRAKSGKIDIKLQTQFLLNQLSELDKKLDELKINHINMMQEYTKVHPALAATNTQIDALNLQRTKLEHELKKLPASDQIAVNLLRDVNVKKTLYLLLLNRIQELEVVKAGTVSSVHILSYAKLPDSSLQKSRSVVYVGCVLLGLMLSALIIFGRKLLSPRVNDPHWSERNLNLANLAIIPFCKEQVDSSLLLDKSKQLPLLAYTNPRNLSIESLRSLRTSLQVSLACASNNLISILGITPGVGKSFVSANLAYLLATAGKRVVLIDADLRRGTLHKYMNVSSSPGLADILNHSAIIENALVATMHENLSFLPRGVYPDDPSELLMRDDFKVLMTALSAQYDIVIVDTAPVLLVTDAVVVSGLTGTNYLVMGAGAHQPMEIDMALKRLLAAGVQVQGSIYNFYRAKAKQHSYGYGKYYSYNYYYDDSLKT